VPNDGPVTLDLTGVDLTTEVVRTERLVLRPYRSDDVEAVYAACQDPDIQRWIGVLPSPYTRDDARGFVTELAPGDRASGRGMPVAIEAGGRLVGSSGLQFWPGRLGPEIGYWVAAGERGKGYAAEATRGLASWAFGRGADRVHLWVDVGNAVSQTVARRAGFTEDGVVRSVLDRRDGSRGDAVLFSRLPGD
jgi:RimJ/RimL family protein N-acetyltransferase